MKKKEYLNSDSDQRVGMLNKKILALQNHNKILVREVNKLRKEINRLGRGEVKYRL